MPEFSTPETMLPIDAERTGVSVAYRNKAHIADDVLPRIPVGKQVFKYMVRDAKDAFTIPSTLVGRKSQVNQVESGWKEEAGFTENYGLEEGVPKDDIDNAPAGTDILSQKVVALTDLIALDREKRVAGLVFNAATYPTANQIELTGVGQYSHKDSNPLKSILEYLETPIMRPNVIVFGQRAWLAFRTHPKVVSAALGNSGENGVASRAAVAGFLEVDEILIGSALYNANNKGQENTALTPLWGKHIAMFYRDKIADATAGGRVTFGFTAQFGDRIVRTVENYKMGVGGGTDLIVGERVREVVCAPDLGFFIQNAVA